MASPEDIVLAIREQYRHRLDQPVTDASLTQAILFLAERAEVLVGIWGIGLAPTGERDPYALRRAALGLISAYEQLQAGAPIEGQ
jgi:glycyl-tRNA synthetase beta chain